MKLFLLLSTLTVTLHISKNYRDAKGNEQIGMATCTGVFISPNEILTAAHCVEHSRWHQWILTNDNKSFAADVEAIDHYRDLALLKLPNIKPHKYTVLGNDAYITEEVYTVNSGEEMIGTYGRGIVQNIVDIDEEASVFILHSIAILHGASGSGLFDRKGHLVGINTRTRGAFSLATNTGDIRTFLDKYASKTN